jgi:phosphatidylinositol glycan class V
MLWLLFYSSVTTLRIGSAQPLHGRAVPHTSDTYSSNSARPVRCDLPELALPQLLLVLAAATSFHVQIINRIASGYPIWYLTVATWLVGQQPGLQKGKQSNRGQWAVRAMIMYSMVQGVLFANFLPPA